MYKKIPAYFSSSEDNSFEKNLPKKIPTPDKSLSIPSNKTITIIAMDP